MLLRHQYNDNTEIRLTLGLNNWQGSPPICPFYKNVILKANIHSADRKSVRPFSFYRFNIITLRLVDVASSSLWLLMQSTPHVARCIKVSCLACLSEVSLWLTAWGWGLQRGFGLVTGGLDSSTEVRIIDWLQTQLCILPDSLWKLLWGNQKGHLWPLEFQDYFHIWRGLVDGGWDAKPISEFFNRRFALLEWKINDRTLKRQSHLQLFSICIDVLASSVGMLISHQTLSQTSLWAFRDAA